MTANDLIEYLFKTSGVKNPHYTNEEHKLWVMGFLASIVSEKNHMDNLVWQRVRQRIEKLTDS